MKILFFIATGKEHGHASGGHYHSLDQVSKEISKIHEVKIVSLGAEKSPVLSSNPYFLKHVKLTNNAFSLIKLNNELKKILRQFKPDIVHSFSAKPIKWLLLQPKLFSMPLVMTKCGGPNPNGKDYIHLNGIVVFSFENYEWFGQNKNYKDDVLELISNRVKKLEFLPQNSRVEHKDPNKITFVRISRLGGAYEHTLLATFNLIEKLSLKGFDVELFVIGRIQDENRFEILKKVATGKNLPVKYITDERASKASDFLYLADFAIGTGRSFMEAVSLGIPTFAPAINSDIPILIDSENIQTFYKMNFSERTIVHPNEISKNFDKVLDVIQDKKKRDDISLESKKLFDDLFGTEYISKRYNEFYSKVLNKNISRLSLIRKNWKYVLRFIFFGK